MLYLEKQSLLIERNKSLKIVLNRKILNKIDNRIGKLFVSQHFSKNELSYGDFFSHLNDLGKEKLKIIEEMFWDGFDEKENISFENFNKVLKKSILEYIKKGRCPFFNELKNDLLSALSNEITEKNYVFKVFGIDFKDDPPSSFPLRKADEELLKKIEFDGNSGDFKIGDLILVITSFGDMEKALEKSIYKANLILAVVSVLVCSNFKEAGRKFKISIVSPTIGPEVGVIYGWDEKGALWNKKFNSPPIFIDKNIYSIYEKGYDQIVKEIKEESDTEVFRLIKAALFWFFEAQKDFTVYFSFIKYWTSIEIFFSFKDSEDSKITDKNKKGVSCLVNASGIFEEKIEELISKIGKLYDKRSKALHDGNYMDIEKKDVDNISIYAATSILGVIFLYNEGKIKSRKDIFLLMNKYHANN